MKRVGLFVGIDKYKNGIAPLQCAVSDAKSLSSAFSWAQFDEVESLLNEEAHCETILETVETLVGDLNAGDLFVFYFSGHGREYQNTHYLVGSTGRASTEFYQRGSVSLPELISASNKPGVNRLFILDCCRSNILADRDGEYSCDNARDISFKAAISNIQNTTVIPPLILSSCSIGEQAFEDPDSRHGYFTTALLKCIKSDSIRNFQQFQDGLRIIGTPRPQNISWNGNLNNWYSIPLLKKWGDPVAPAPTAERVAVPVSAPAPTAERVAVPAQEANQKNMFHPESGVKMIDLEEGRASRKEYWIYQMRWWLITLSIAMLVQTLYFVVGGGSYFETIIYTSFLVLFIAAETTFGSWKAMAVRRLHDVGKDKKYLYWILLPVFGWIYLIKILSAESEPGSNQYGRTKGFRYEKWNSLWVLGGLSAVFLFLIFFLPTVQILGSKIGLVQNITLPGFMTKISSSAFKDTKNLKSVIIPDGVNVIEMMAFSNCTNLTSVIIPESVQHIGDLAFSKCANLKNITLPDNLKSINTGTFFECSSLTNIKIPKEVRKIKSAAFRDCINLTSVTLPDNLLEIEKYAFCNCRRLNSITIPNRVMTIGDAAFAGCKNLTSIVIPNGVQDIGREAFFLCISLKSITLPRRMTKIGYSTFAECSSLESITIPNNVTAIGGKAFSDCTSLANVTIPDSVKTIGPAAFSGCKSLKQVSIPKQCKISEDSFPKGCKIIRR